jgi:LysM repeat protein
MVDPKNNTREKFVIHEDRSEEATSEWRSASYDDNAADVFRKKSIIPFVIGGLGLMVLIIVVAGLFTTSPDTVDLDHVQSLEIRISELETQLTARKNLNQVLERIDKQETELKLTSQKLNRFESTVTNQIDQIIEEIGALNQNRAQKPSAAAPKPKTAAKKQLSGSQEPTSTSRFHVVQSGETLYRISRRYGLTVDQLRNYNDLASDATIYPGQKLELKPR